MIKVNLPTSVIGIQILLPEDFDPIVAHILTYIVLYVVTQVTNCVLCPSIDLLPCLPPHLALLLMY